MIDRELLDYIARLEVRIAALEEVEERRQAMKHVARDDRIGRALSRGAVRRKLSDTEMLRLGEWLRAHPEAFDRIAEPTRLRTVRSWRDGNGRTAQRAKLDVVWEQDLGLAGWELEELLSGSTEEEAQAA